MVNGEPTPTVTWARNNGNVEDPEKYKTRFDERAREHVLEVRKEYLKTFKGQVSHTVLEQATRHRR